MSNPESDTAAPAKATPLDIWRIAAMAEADPRTVRSYLLEPKTPSRNSRMTRDRIARAVDALNLGHLRARPVQTMTPTGDQ